MDERAAALSAVEAMLAGTRVEHVLIGGLAVGHHGRERATLDVDMLVSRQRLVALKKIVEAHGYMALKTADMVRVYPRGGNPSTDSIADLVGAESNPVLRAAFKEHEMATVLGHRVKVVKRGALVALKFHSAMSTTRALEDKYQDVADIGRIIQRKFSTEDARLAHRIAALSYPGAGNDFNKMIDDLRHGRPVTL
jgi:hypothetical protein